MPKVSIIIPTYNQARFITNTINSILEQTYKDFEIVVINDGSTDNTNEQLEKLGNKIKVINQENSERAIARNNGVKNSNGKYLAFVDSDDIWKPHKLERQAQVLEQSLDTALVYSTCERIDENGREIKTAKRQTKGYSGNVFEKLLCRNFIVSATPLVKREYFDNTTGFETKYVPYEDWELWIRLSVLGKFHFLTSPLAYYRIHPRQTIKNIKAEKIEKITCSILEDSFKLQDISTGIKRKSQGLANLRFCYWYLLANDINKAKEKIKKAIEFYPEFLIDPRWYGLQLLCEFPHLKGKGIFNLAQYH